MIHHNSRKPNIINPNINIIIPGINTINLMIIIIKCKKNIINACIIIINPNIIKSNIKPNLTNPILNHNIINTI